MEVLVNHCVRGTVILSIAQDHYFLLADIRIQLAASYFTVFARISLMWGIYGIRD